jgi:RimJ/RimL family protein N-acetyltransferase
MIELREGRGGRVHAGVSGAYWHIFLDGRRVGHVAVVDAEDETFGQHGAIDIHVNQDQRGRQIGRVAYRLAAEQSARATVVARMRKQNAASRRAAEAAGFVAAPEAPGTQLTLVWRRAPA